VDAEALRQRWPEILDAVRSEKKVAWMLLNTASVQELQNGVLTIAFPSEGNARGFASSGHDQVLTSALAAMLGLNVRVRAVAGGGPAASPAAGGRAARGLAARNGPAQGNPAGPPSADPPAGPPATTRPEGRTRGPDAPQEGGRAAGGSVAGGRQAEPRSRQAPPPQPAGSAEEEWPDDASGPGTGAENLTGMELIRRQLGGRVIQEIEDS
jgi:DNA polymerase-3 subunit gamma/tau